MTNTIHQTASNSAPIFLLVDLSWASGEWTEERDIQAIQSSLNLLNESLIHTYCSTLLLLLPEEVDLEIPTGLLNLCNSKQQDFAPLNSQVRTTTAKIEQFLMRAAETHADILILDGRAIPSLDALTALIQGLDDRFHFGVAIPRIAERVSGNLLAIPLDVTSQAKAIAPAAENYVPRSALPVLPPAYQTTELFGSAIYIHRRVAANLTPKLVIDETAGTAIGSYLAQIRRAGFRTQVVNCSVFLESPLLRTFGNGPRPDINSERIILQLPCTRRAGQEFAQHYSHRLEPMLQAAFVEKRKCQRSLLLDARGLSPLYNGTTYALLGFTDALLKNSPEWSITLHVTQESADFHDLKRRYPDWTIATKEPTEFFSCVLRTAQPWAVSDLQYAHRRGLMNFFSILDTIAWDIVFAAPDGLTATWQIASETADGFLYISDYSGAHFRKRFPLGKGVRELVEHLSFHPDDYIDHQMLATRSQSSTPTAKPYILIVGNDYDHKCVIPTVSFLAQAFPLTEIRVLGWKGDGQRLVKGYESGTLPESLVEELYADASAVIFPSLYEGFGFPLLKGLSYGKLVAARESELVHEILRNHKSTGQAVTYQFNDDLLEIIGAHLHGHPIKTIPLGTALQIGEEPLNWCGIAKRVTDFLDASLLDFDIDLWLRRDSWFTTAKAIGF